jgi:hypothetical protein
VVPGAEQRTGNQAADAQPGAEGGVLDVGEPELGGDGPFDAMQRLVG